MKIGVITFHHNNNFGAALQCYALQKALKVQGHDASVIHYIPKEAEPVPLLRGWNFASGGLVNGVAARRLRQLRYQRVATESFERFRLNYLTLSDRCSSDKEVESVVSEYDAIITGSDQVWVFSRPSHYFLELSESYKGKRISYAACCGHDQHQPEKVDRATPWLRRIDSVSVRNDFSKKIVAKLVDKPVSVVADPTLLVDLSDIEEPRTLPVEKYIMVYTLSGDRCGHHADVIASIKKRVGDLPVVAVVANSCPYGSPEADYTLYDVSPTEWIWLIANTAFLYTDSYHGALFAIRNHTPFIVEYTEGWRSLRLLDIVQRYGLEDVVAHSAEDAVRKVKNFNFNFEQALNIIAEHSAFSLAFLRESLG